MISRVSPFVEMIANDIPPGIALDVGAGDGRNSQFLVEAGWVVDVVEPSQPFVNNLIESRLYRNVWASTFEEATIPDAPYDLVVCNMVLHFLSSERAVQEFLLRLGDCVGPQGVAYIAVFSEDNLPSIRPHLARLGEILPNFPEWELHILDAKPTNATAICRELPDFKANVWRFVLRRAALD